MAEHTPGPWFRRQFHEFDIIARDDWDESTKIALVHGWNDVLDANANLVAAAPDLLAACESFIEFHDTLIEGEHIVRYDEHNGEVDDIGYTINLFRAAIAKAKGA